MSKALYFRDLYLRIGGKQIFSELSLEAERGEIIGVCGTSGSNMHYLVNLLTRTYDAPYTLTGSLLVDGAEIEKLSSEDMRFARMMNIAVLPKVEVAENLQMSVLQYITLPYKKESTKKSVHEIITDTKRIMQLLGVTDTERIFRKKMNTLHIKDLRAVLYATALSTDPAVAIVFADAPDMSPNENDELYTLLIKVCKIKNITLLFLTSDIHFACRYGEQVLIAKNDRLLPIDGTPHPHLQYLEAAAEMRTFSIESGTEEELLSCVHVVPQRGMQSVNFVLHSGEMYAFSCKNGIKLFTGKRTPISGSILQGGAPIGKIKGFIKTVMPVDASLPLPPFETAEKVVQAYTVRSSQRLSTSHLYTALGLTSDYGKTLLKNISVYEKLRLGLICAAVSESKIILLSDIDLIPSSSDRYDILTLLSAVCAHNGAGAIIFSGCTDVLHAVGTKFHYEAEKTEELTNDETEQITTEV